MNKRLYPPLLIILFTFNALQAQEKYTLNGYVRDATNGEELIGASLYLPSIKSGEVTNVYGFYALTLPRGTYDIQVSYLGYTTQVLQVVLDQNKELNIAMAPKAVELEGVVVTDRPLDANVSEVQMSKNELKMDQLRKLPALFGEVDILKAIQMLPGVITAGEGTSSFYVRGGSADQNLILIDEAPVYDPSHLFGLFSVFNADVIKDSELYKGGIPARYGGRLSSILDVRTRDGNNQNFEGSGGIGTLAARLAVEGPIQPEKSSYIFSARRSYADLFLKAAGQDNLVGFYDLNAKVNWRSQNTNRFFVAFYAGRDNFNFGNDFNFGWGNATGTFRWNHLFNERLFSNTSLIVSNFDYKLELMDPVQGFNWKSNLQELSLKNDLSYYINQKHELSFGYHLTGRRYFPARISPNTDESIFETVELDKEYALDHAVYVADKFDISNRLTLDYGIRLSVFQNIGPADVILYENPKDNIDINRTGSLHYKSFETIKAFVNPEPRVALRYKLAPDQSLKFSYNRMVQNTHLISNGTVPVPFNTWSPSGYYLSPQIADQFAGGYFRNFKDNQYEFSVEAYYKDFSNITDFADNAELLFNEDVVTEYRQGQSWSTGLELFLVKTKGDLTGQISYTLSKTMRKVEGVNLNRWFPANYDRRNVVNLFATYDVDDRWSIGVNFTYGTGRPITLPVGKFEYDGYKPDYITERNGYRLPDYHRMDLSATYTSRKNTHRKWKSEWVFSIYNVYNRKNPFTIYTRLKEDDEGKLVGNGTEKEARLISLFPILPSVTYNFKF